MHAVPGHPVETILNTIISVRHTAEHFAAICKGSRDQQLRVALHERKPGNSDSL